MADAKARVLVADDSPEVRLLLRRLLGALGHEVAEAGDGQEAMEFLALQRPDLLITDLSMPRLGGLDLVARLRKVPGLRDLPVMVYSSDSDEGTRRRLRDAGVSVLVEKPGTPGAIRSAVQSLLSRAPAGAPGLNRTPAPVEPVPAGRAAVLVERSEPEAALLEEYLLAEGYEILPERNFSGILNRICREGPPGLTILDWRTEREEALGLVRLIRSTRAPRAARILMLCRRLDVPTLIQAARAGVDQCLIEPITRTALRERLRELGLA